MDEKKEKYYQELRTRLLLHTKLKVKMLASSFKT